MVEKLHTGLLAAMLYENTDPATVQQQYATVAGRDLTRLIADRAAVPVSTPVQLKAAGRR